MNNVVDTARQEGEKKGREEGREEGRLSERSLMLLRLLPRTVGELSDDLKTQINQLSIEKLDALTELFLDFTDLNDLVNWLQNTPD
jgi:predicted transposase YdaD